MTVSQLERKRQRQREATARYRLAHRERVAEYRRTHVAETRAATARRKATPTGWAKTAIARIRSRAKKAGIEFSIVWQDILPPKTCPVLGELLTLTGQHGRMHWWSASVDRFDNSKGYTRENVRVISNRANLLKKDADAGELRAVLTYMETAA